MRIKEIRSKGYPQIADLAIIRSNQQGKKCGEKSDIRESTTLDWGDTFEGASFWNLINSGFFAEAYHIYPGYFDIYYARTPEEVFMDSCNDMDRKLKQLEDKYNSYGPFHSLLGSILNCIFIYSGLTNVIDPKTRKKGYLFFICALCVMFMDPIDDDCKHTVVQSNFSYTVDNMSGPVIGYMWHDTIHLEIK